MIFSTGVDLEIPSSMATVMDSARLSTPLSSGPLASSLRMGGRRGVSVDLYPSQSVLLQFSRVRGGMLVSGLVGRSSLVVIAA